FFIMQRSPPSTTLIPYTTLFRSFNKLRAALKQAVKDGIIPTNPAEGVDGFKQGEPQREFLTLEELQAAVKEECEIPQMKTAFILDRKSTRLNSSHVKISYAVFCL